MLLALWYYTKRSHILLPAYTSRLYSFKQFPFLFDIYTPWLLPCGVYLTVRRRGILLSGNILCLPTHLFLAQWFLRQEQLHSTHRHTGRLTSPDFSSLPCFLGVFFFSGSVCPAVLQLRASVDGVMPDPCKEGQREHRELGLIAFQTWQNHSWSLTKSGPGDSQLGLTQKEGQAGLKRQLMDGGGKKKKVCATKTDHCMTMFCFDWKWLLLEIHMKRAENQRQRGESET